MHPNIAQISRWWVAKSILTQNIDINNLMPLLHTTNHQDISTSIFREAVPYNLAPLDHPISGTSSFNLTINPLRPPMYDLSSNSNEKPQTGNYSSSYQTQESSNIHYIPVFEEHIKHLSPSPYTPTDRTQELISNQYSTHPRQNSLHRWLEHSPFIPNVPSTSHPDSTSVSSSHPASACQTFKNHLAPYGTLLPPIDPSKILRVCLQNTQHDFRIFGDGIEMISIQNHLSSIGTYVFAPISPNINWKNSTNWPRTRQIFRYTLQHVHLSASSSNIGLDPLYLHKHLIGGAAILSFGLWASKVSHSFSDESGHGSFAVTTIQGKGNKHISLIAAYISVQKGLEIGTESVYAQQQTIYERDMLKLGKLPNQKFCPRNNAIRNLNHLIMQLQQQHHAIILMIDANQSLPECFSGKDIKPFSIEWLRLQRGMDDPFIQLMQSRPNSTTIHPNRDTDYVFTYGIHIANITTLSPNLPATSDHLGIVFDVDVASYFSSSYSTICSPNPRILNLR